MKDIIDSYSKLETGRVRKFIIGIEWRFARMIFGSFLINVFKETLTPVLFGNSGQK
jgi:hypothetical protein